MSLLNPTDDYSQHKDFEEYARACDHLSTAFNNVVAMERELKHRYGPNWETLYNSYLFSKGNDWKRYCSKYIISDEFYGPDNSAF